MLSPPLSPLPPSPLPPLPTTSLHTLRSAPAMASFTVAACATPPPRDLGTASVAAGASSADDDGQALLWQLRADETPPPSQSTPREDTDAEGAGLARHGSGGDAPEAEDTAAATPLPPYRRPATVGPPRTPARSHAFLAVLQRTGRISARRACLPASSPLAAAPEERGIVGAHTLSARSPTWSPR